MANAQLRIFDTIVHLEDTEPLVVQVDQRDTSAWELTEMARTDGPRATPQTFMRWTAWHAMKRVSLTRLTWPDFDARCILATDHVPDAAPAAPAPDPLTGEVDTDTPLGAGR